MSAPALSVVIPVYNEEQAIGPVVREWLDRLSGLGVAFEVRCYDDGSKDSTLEVLRGLEADDARVIVTTHPNRGHGPTILRGYTEARGEWIFQVDGDGEIDASRFPEFWAARADRDVVQGRRTNRNSPGHRRLLTAGARAVVALLFGGSPADANVPYRLMRATWLRSQLPLISPSTGVPNVILSGLASRNARIREIDVEFRPRRAGASTLNIRRIARLAGRAVLDTMRVAWRDRIR